MPPPFAAEATETTSPVVSVETASNSPATSDFIVGGGSFFGWFRYSHTDFPTQPVDFDALWAGGTDLLTDSSGAKRVSLLPDWFFLYKASFSCHGAETWETTVTNPIGEVFDERNAFDASCNYFLYDNGALVFQEGPGIGTVRFVSGGFIQRCNTRMVGLWKFTLSHDGLPFVVPESEMTTTPQVVSAGKDLQLVVDPASVTPHFPDETTLPLSGPGFTLLEVPGGASNVTATVREDDCPNVVSGYPLQIAVVFPGSDDAIVFPNGSGGHTHQKTDTSAYPNAIEAVVPSTRGASVAADGTVTSPTDSAGQVKVALTAGQTSGLVLVNASAGPAAPAPTPTPQSGQLTVARPGLVPITNHNSEANPPYLLTGNVLQPPSGSAGANHLDNHWVDPSMQAHIDGIAADFNAFYPNLRLEIDDASLVFGGLFDIGGNFSFSPGHSFHRRGKDFDVRLTAFDVTTGNRLAPISKKNLQLAIKHYVNDNFGVYAPEPQIHLRFP